MKTKKRTTTYVDFGYFGPRKGNMSFMFDVLPVLNLQRTLWDERTEYMIAFYWLFWNVTIDIRIKKKLSKQKD